MENIGPNKSICGIEFDTWNTCSVCGELSEKTVMFQHAHYSNGTFPLWVCICPECLGIMNILIKGED